MPIAVADRPLFVVGAPRSGTSMLAHALRCHPALWGGEESDFLGPLARDTLAAHAFGTSRLERQWLHQQRVSTSELLAAVGLGINVLYTSRSGGRRWVEQTPEYTLWIDRLAEMFPDALFLLLVRDGREVAHSLLHFEANRHDLPDGAALWRRFASAGAAAVRAFPERVLEIDFRRLVADPDAGLARVLAFADVPHDPACAELVRSGPINSSFADRAGARWQAWSRAQRAEFHEIAGDLLVELGFEPDAAWVDSGGER